MDFNYMHEYRPNRQGKCKVMVGGRKTGYELCHQPWEAEPHRRWRLQAAKDLDDATRSWTNESLQQLLHGKQRRTMDTIRKFSDQNIQASIDKVLAELPTDKKGAVVAFANQASVGLAVTAKLGEHWSVVGVLDKPWKGQLEAEAVVRFAW